MHKLFFAGFLLIAVAATASAQSSKPVHGTKPGNAAPEIRLPGPKGDTISLSSKKGKIVLIDFWASWCAPCVGEQPELAVLYRKYRHTAFKGAMGFEIFGVSLDSKKAEWVNAINKLGITWTQVSDLKFWNSGAAKSYQIESLPYNVLINGNGTVIATDLHGTDLEKMLLKIKSAK
ncbi:TlpA family protein disulfide reductase [Mucilaginibacter sp.]|jgi:thiol-disulfide isomerase/thioredoxin|uniref:TlpA family protein disulfide reductase n=1 Tax=Mucilaginibacter sp. TaxID=1882438 RepID=UPI0035668D30